MPRKPLIAPGSMLPEGAAESLMERVIDRDRTRSGRQNPAPAASSPTPGEDDSNIAIYQVSKIDSKQDSHAASYDASKTESEVAREIAVLRATPLSQLNIRIPDGLADWLDEEAHRRRKEKVTKQALVTDAIAEFIARRMAAEMEGEDR